LERRLDGGGHELRSFRVDDDVPAEQHAAGDLPGVILGRAPRPLIKPQVRRRDPDLLRDERDSLVRQLRAARREPPMPV
jgi:hypothetical protein